MAYEMVVSKPGVLRLAKDLLEKTQELYIIANSAKESIDALSLSFEDSSFAKVDAAMALATSGFELMQPSIVNGAANLVKFANNL